MVVYSGNSSNAFWPEKFGKKWLENSQILNFQNCQRICFKNIGSNHCFVKENFYEMTNRLVVFLYEFARKTPVFIDCTLTFHFLSDSVKPTRFLKGTVIMTNLLIKVQADGKYCGKCEYCAEYTGTKDGATCELCGDRGFEDLKQDGKKWLRTRKCLAAERAAQKLAGK